MMKFALFAIRGIPVAAIDVFNARDTVCEYAAAAQGAYVTVTGAHGVVESVDSIAVLDAHRRAAIVVADGMPLVWLGRLLGFSSTGRVNGPELMELIFAEPQYRELRHFFYGGNPGSVALLVKALAARFGEFNMVGVHCPPMRPLGFVEDDDVIARIRDLKPHLIWVGLSTPKQEVWMNMHMSRIGSGIAVGVGAAFDLLSGTTRRAPRWIQRSGFEWLFRLLIEPRRLYRRYAVVIPRFSYYWLDALLKRGAIHSEGSLKSCGSRQLP
jgi:N-acetylglucosaminyldiphosphoundecaprenol N-acetyl-beta-D-mannosaminyltransferase